ncbi:hypothetical protein [Nannocystis bainbridge]|uniref:Receptor L-domain domain-containing protein n=1 Tax=Nannocystis bainbridge TaxID=2995303 RepID=A0ABT5E3B0_9BACT|nr:hypothetical protein [Nannocystis bainbridge]MDC0720356.1 hypothetical protein [Nannocystis bainbridge]
MAPRRSPLPLIAHATALAILLTACAPHKGDSATTDSATSDASDSATAANSTTDSSTPTTTEASCADVVAGDLMISDATDIATLACVVEVQGELRVSDTTTWSNLTPLANLRLVGGDVKLLRNAALVDLAGLQGLERVGGSITIVGNPQLADLSGLGGVRRLGGLGINNNALVSLAGLQDDVVFEAAQGGPAGFSVVNETLTDFDGLSAITTASAPQGLNLSVSEMPALTDVSGLDVFAAVEGPIELTLRELPALTGLQWPGPLELLNIRDAPALHELVLPAVVDAREISFERVPALTSLAGLAALRSVSEVLSLGPCNGDGLAGIVDLHGLESLEQAGIVYIDSNASLAALTGLPTSLQADNVFIWHNPALPQADADAWLVAAGLAEHAASEACDNLGGPACELSCPVY